MEVFSEAERVESGGRIVLIDYVDLEPAVSGIDDLSSAFSKAFDESKFVRDEIGRFAKKPGVGSAVGDDASGGDTVPAAHAAVAARFGIPVKAVSDIANLPVEELKRRDEYMPPSNAMEPELNFERFPLGSVKIDSWRSDTEEAYVNILTEFNPNDLRNAEAEDGIKKRNPSYPLYVEWAKQGIESPPISTGDSWDGTYIVSSNRRRVLAAQDAGLDSITSWHSLLNKETNLPLKYGDVLRALKEASVEEKPATNYDGRLSALHERRGENADGVSMAATETPEFKAWFGDSKVVDGDGKPLVVYHGTSAVQDFSEFSTSSGGRNETSSLGLWFANDPRVADLFSSIPTLEWGYYPGVKDYSLASKLSDDGGYGFVVGDPVDGESHVSLESQNSRTVPVYLSLQNPKVYKVGDDPFIEMMNDRDEFVTYMDGTSGERGYWRKGKSPLDSSGVYSRRFVEHLVSQGYDGIILQGTRFDSPDAANKVLTDQYVVFDSKQVKSAIGNNGSFSRESSDIRKAFSAVFKNCGTGDGGFRPGNTCAKGEGSGSSSSGDKTSTPEFKAWFGDSKIVDDDGKPLVVYHGTKGDFDEFDLSKTGMNSGNAGFYGKGFYFSVERLEAETYGDNVIESYLSIKNPWMFSDESLDELREAGVDWVPEKEGRSLDTDSVRSALKEIDSVAAELFDAIVESNYGDGWEKFQASHPDWISHTGVDLNDVGSLAAMVPGGEDTVNGLPHWADRVLEDVGIQDRVKKNMGYGWTPALHHLLDMGAGDKSTEFAEVLRSLGYDGVWYGTEIVAFDPRQIKSVDNEGTFDPQSAKFRKAFSGIRKAFLKEFDESKIKRDGHGRFADKPDVDRSAGESPSVAMAKPVLSEERRAEIANYNHLLGITERETGIDEMSIMSMFPDGIDEPAQVKFMQDLIEEYKTKPLVWEPEFDFDPAKFSTYEGESDEKREDRLENWRLMFELRGRFRDTLKLSKLSNEKKRANLEELQKVITWMPKAALRSALTNIQGVDWFDSHYALTKDAKEGRGELMSAGLIGGYWAHSGYGFGTLTLDGDKFASQDHGGIYAHEIGHVVDFIPGSGESDDVEVYNDAGVSIGKSYQMPSAISDTTEWRQAFAKEIASGQLSKYGATHHGEGFAEFARLLWGQRVSPRFVRDDYPLSYAVFQKYGLAK